MPWHTCTTEWLSLIYTQQKCTDWTKLWNSTELYDCVLMCDILYLSPQHKMQSRDTDDISATATEDTNPKGKCSIQQIKFSYFDTYVPHSSTAGHRPFPCYAKRSLTIYRQIIINQPSGPTGLPTPLCQFVSLSPKTYFLNSVVGFSADAATSPFQ